MAGAIRLRQRPDTRPKQAAASRRKVVPRPEELFLQRLLAAGTSIDECYAGARDAFPLGRSYEAEVLPDGPGDPDYCFDDAGEASLDEARSPFEERNAGTTALREGVAIVIEALPAGGFEAKIVSSLPGAEIHHQVLSAADEAELEDWFDEWGTGLRFQENLMLAIASLWCSRQKRFLELQRSGVPAERSEALLHLNFTPRQWFVSRLAGDGAGEGPMRGVSQRQIQNILTNILGRKGLWRNVPVTLPGGRMMRARRLAVMSKQDPDDMLSRTEIPSPQALSYAWWRIRRRVRKGMPAGRFPAAKALAGIRSLLAAVRGGDTGAVMDKIFKKPDKLRQWLFLKSETERRWYERKTKLRQERRT